MAYRATVFEITIVSFGNVAEERKLAHEIIRDWNSTHSAARRIVLMPVRWDTLGVVSTGTGPETIINERAPEKCDLLIGIFRKETGATKREALIVAVDGIEIHLKAGKPAMVYFSSPSPSPDRADRGEPDRLKTFKATCHAIGISDEYSSTADFGQKLGRDLAKALNEDHYLANLLLSPETGEAATSQESQTGSMLISPPPDLSEEARELLIEAAQDRGGLVRKFSQGTHGISLFVNRTSFGNEDDPKTAATWQDALNQLVDNGLLEPHGTTDVELRITRRGYECAALLGDGR